MQGKTTQRRPAAKAQTLKPASKPKTKASIKISTVEVSSNDSDQLDANHALGLQEFEERVTDVRESCWSNDSLFEDIIDGVEEAKYNPNDTEQCRPDEAYRLRQLLRTIGPAEFCKRTLDSGKYTIKRLLSAFGIKAPAFLDGAEDEAYLSLLTLAFSRELSKRAKLPRYNSVNDAVDLLHKSQNIMVITGAGISTSLGIPDFRSKNTGLYSQLERMGLAINDPQEVFDINVFRDDPTIFFSVAQEILVKTNNYSPTHHFIAMLDKMGKLLTNYTQNIDNVEALAGIDPERMIQCHGSFATATCQICGYHCPGEDIFPDIHAKKIPRCPRCIKKLQIRPGGRTKRKRSAGSTTSANRKRGGRRHTTDSDDDEDSDYDIPQAGIMKPDITFFGEDLPDAFGRRLTSHDRDKVDLVLVIGTSLKVTPVSEIVSWLPAHVPQICISLDPIQHMNFDIDLLGECDIVLAEMARRAGWSMEHEMIPGSQVVGVESEPGFSHRHRFCQTHPSKQATQAQPTLILKGPDGS